MSPELWVRGPHWAAPRQGRWAWVTASCWARRFSNLFYKAEGSFPRQELKLWESECSLWLQGVGNQAGEVLLGQAAQNTCLPGRTNSQPLSFLHATPMPAYAHDPQRGQQICRGLTDIDGSAREPSQCLFTLGSPYAGLGTYFVYLVQCLVCLNGAHTKQLENFTKNSDLILISFEKAEDETTLGPFCCTAGWLALYGACLHAPWVMYPCPSPHHLLLPQARQMSLIFHLVFGLLAPEL